MLTTKHIFLLLFTIYYLDGFGQLVIKEGTYKIYDSDSSHLKAIEVYHKNLKNGVWSIYHEGGDSVNIIYEEGKLIRECYWNHSGILVFDVNYRYNTRDTLATFIDWSDTLPALMLSKKYVLNYRSVGYEFVKYNNGYLKSEGFYSRDTNDNILNRNEYFSFLEDFYINGVTCEFYEGSGFAVTTEELKNQYYENGSVKVKIIPAKNEKLKGRVEYYSNTGLIQKVISIEYGKLSKSEVDKIIDKVKAPGIIRNIILEMSSENPSCWYLEGPSFYYNEYGILDKKMVFHKGIIK